MEKILNIGIYQYEKTRSKDYSFDLSWNNSSLPGTIAVRPNAIMKINDNIIANKTHFSSWLNLSGAKNRKLIKKSSR